MNKNQKKIDYFQDNLIKWGAKNLRNLPWREKNRNIYFILISELLLKRTSATQVKKIINIFIEKYPTIEKLAASNPDELKDILKPLGLYNRRVKILKKISKQIINDYKGKIPKDYEKLISLYGIGKYIANALLCFYYKRKVPIVDSNVIRIFKRFFNFKSEKKYIEDDPKIWSFANEILPERKYLIFNYSLLDFGQLICKSRNPLCEGCPLSKKCFYNNRTNS